MSGVLCVCTWQAQSLDELKEVVTAILVTVKSREREAIIRVTSSLLLLLPPLLLRILRMRTITHGKNKNYYFIQSCFPSCNRYVCGFK
jgi:hypothetical protein